jgi:hypothetical protein
LGFPIFLHLTRQIAGNKTARTEFRRPKQLRVPAANGARTINWIAFALNYDAFSFPCIYVSSINSTQSGMLDQT